MTLPASLFEQPKHIVVQKRRAVPLSGTVRLAKRQDRTMPLNTAAQKAGVRYENRIELLLRQATVDYACHLHSHVWFDIDGRAAQTDFFLTFPSKAAILFEVKQTWVDTSEQLAFYKYLLNGIGLASVTCCTICKNLTPKTPRDDIIRSFEDIKENAVWQIRI
jgi:hypothetical protein